MRMCVFTVAAVFLLGCDWIEHQRFEADLEDRCAKADARVGQVNLVESATGRLDPIRPALRVLITPTAVHVDNTALVAEWWRVASSPKPGWPVEPPTPSEWESLDELIVDVENAAAIRDGKFDPADLRDGPAGLLINPLFDVFKDVARTSKEHAARTGIDFTGKMNIYLDQRVPYGILARVIYTAGQAEYESPTYVLQSGGKPVDLAISHARCSPACGTRPQQGDTDYCMYPELSVLPQGLVLRAGRRHQGRVQQAFSPETIEKLRAKGLFGGIASDAGPPPQTTPAPVPATRPAFAWENAILLGPHRSCPSVRRVGGKIDLATLGRLLLESKRRVPPCSGARIGAAEQIPWSDLAPVIETLRHRGGFKWQGFTAPVDPAEAISGCDHGVTPAALTTK